MQCSTLINRLLTSTTYILIKIKILSVCVYSYKESKKNVTMASAHIHKECTFNCIHIHTQRLFINHQESSTQTCNTFVRCWFEMHFMHNIFIPHNEKEKLRHAECFVRHSLAMVQMFCTIYRFAS